MKLSKFLLPAIAIGLCAIQPAKAWELAGVEAQMPPWESSFNHALDRTEFSLSVIRRSFVYSLGRESLGEWAQAEKRTMSLSLVREDDMALADLRLLPTPQPTSNYFAWSSLQAGYGQFFSDESLISRGRNAAVWDPPSFIYLKTCFTF